MKLSLIQLFIFFNNLNNDVIKITVLQNFLSINKFFFKNLSNFKQYTIL